MTPQQPHRYDPDIVNRGTAIYRKKYRAAFGLQWKYRFVAIDVDTEQAYVADGHPEYALSEGRRAAPHGRFS